MAHQSSSILLREFLINSKGKCLVLTGAGISTDSGIPDYRGTSGIYVKNPNYKPIRFQEFITHHQCRQRYWARSYLGWPKIEKSKRNTSHELLFELEKRSHVHGLITQNVDGLHLSNNLLELHGSLHQVHCIQCHYQESRSLFQSKLSSLNPSIHDYLKRNLDQKKVDVVDIASSSSSSTVSFPPTNKSSFMSSNIMNPDGDAEVHFDYHSFVYPDCPKCKGILKPSVIFFGENIPVSVKDKSVQMVDESNSLLVLTSSLQVYSAFRLVKRARENEIPIMIVNLGPTRFDKEIKQQSLSNMQLSISPSSTPSSMSIVDSSHKIIKIEEKVMDLLKSVMKTL